MASTTSPTGSLARRVPLLVVVDALALVGCVVAFIVPADVLKGSKVAAIVAGSLFGGLAAGAIFGLGAWLVMRPPLSRRTLIVASLAWAPFLMWFFGAIELGGVDDLGPLATAVVIVGPAAAIAAGWQTFWLRRHARSIRSLYLWSLLAYATGPLGVELGRNVARVVGGTGLLAVWCVVAALGHALVSAGLLRRLVAGRVA